MRWRDTSYLPQFKILEFEQLVEKLMEFEYKVRAYYHKFLDLDGDALLWIMAIDGLFLLEFLYIYMNNNDTCETIDLVDSAGRILTHDAILGDIMMLENQIPFFLLNKILSIQCPSAVHIDENLLPSMLMSFCNAISPLKLKVDQLLDLLYHLMVPKLVETQETSTRDVFNAKLRVDSGNSCQILAAIRNKLSNLNISLPSKITKLSKILIGTLRKIITSFPAGKSTQASKHLENIIPQNGFSSEGQNPPQVKTKMIPSASYLSNLAGVEFCPTTGVITTMKLDEKEKKFYLPLITLNVNSELIMRNLVAYEASIVSDSLVFARYIELVSGIIETTKDAKFLREKKIILNGLRSDDEVLQLFNEISKSIRITNVPYIDKTIEDVNKEQVLLQFVEGPGI